MSVLKPLLVIGGIALISELAFSPVVRKEILRRDRWTCTNPQCIGLYMDIGPLNWHRGWNVQAAHEPEYHQKQEDRNPNHGRCRCVTCHIVEEIERGNHSGAAFLYEQHTIHNKEWLMEHNWYGENRSDKIPFRFFMDWVAAGEEGRQGLSDAFKEKYCIDPDWPDKS